MMEQFNFFTEIQGVFLIKLAIAQLLADFFFQTKKMVANKRWFSKEMFWHIAIVFCVTFLLSNNIFITLIISILHYIIDGLKIEFSKRKKHTETLLFIVDQIAHFVVIMVVWAVYFQVFDQLLEVFLLPISDYKVSLIFFGFLLVTSPYGYLIGKLTSKYQPKNNKKQKIDKNGFYIGIFERIIILAFIMIGEYSVIGFLITGKSIIRFSSKNEETKSEYVLLGTLISYGITILTGLTLQFLLH